MIWGWYWEWYEDMRKVGEWYEENIEKWWVCGNDMRRAGAHWLRNWLTRAHLNKHEGLGCLGAVRARCWGSHPLLKHGFRWNTKVAYLICWTCANPFNRGHRLKQRWNNVPSQSVDKLCVDMWKYTLVSKIHNYTHKDKHLEHKAGKLMACAWGERGFDTKSASIFSGWQPTVASAFMPYACTWPAFCQKVIFLNFRSFWHSPLVPAPPL